MKKEPSISLREYFDNKINELKMYIDLKFNTIEKATCLAQDNMNIRLEKMNEFRSTLSDQAGSFITRMEFDGLSQKYDADIRVLREANARSEGKASMQSVYIGYIIAFIGMILGIIGLLIKI